MSEFGEVSGDEPWQAAGQTLPRRRRPARFHQDAVGIGDLEKCEGDSASMAAPARQAGAKASKIDKSEPFYGVIFFLV